jgi:hypothetical protein
LRLPTNPAQVSGRCIRKALFLLRCFHLMNNTALRNGSYEAET